MAANIEKVNGCFRALGSFLANILTLKFPLWLYIVAFLGCVLLFLLIGCAHDKSLQRVVVGHCDEAGHSYVFFRAENDESSLTVLHDPDCICYFLNSEEDGSN